MSRRQSIALRIAILVLAIGGLGYFATTRISFDTDPLDLLPADLPEAQGLQLFQKRFGKDIDLMIKIEGEDPVAVEEAARSLTEHLLAVPGLVDTAYWHPPGAAEGGSGDIDPLDFAELIAYAWTNAPPESWPALIDKLSPEESEQSLGDAFETLAFGQLVDPEMSVPRASIDPLGIVFSLPELSRLLDSGNSQDQFSALDGRLRLVRAEAPNDISKYKLTIEWLSKVEPAIRAWQANAPPEIRSLHVDWTGRAPYTAEIASAMEREMKWSVAWAIILIHALFFLFYRRVMPIIWLVLCLALTFSITLTIGSFIFEGLGATSVGFAAILIGLAVDYGFVIYQEGLKHGSSPAQLRRKLAHSIGWASVTTAAVFFGLRLSSLPGAIELGTMVGIGIATGAVVMLTVFTWLNDLIPPRERITAGGRGDDSSQRYKFERLLTILLIGAFAITLFTRGLPPVSASADDLRPKQSHASDVFKEIWEKFGWGTRGGFRVIFAGDDQAAVADAIRRADQTLKDDPGEMARESQFPPALLLANPANQNANLPQLREALNAGDRVRRAALDEIERPENIEREHVEDMLALADAIFSHWRRFAAGDFELRTQSSRWVIDSVVSTNMQPACALGNIQLDEKSEATEAEELRLAEKLGQQEGVFPAGWSLLRPAIVRIIRHEVTWVVVPMAAILLVMLWLAFRRLRRVALAICGLLFSALALLAVMRLLDLHPDLEVRWNLMNLAAIPLLLGAGLDYSIHMLLALGRLDGNTAEARRTIGRALVLCGLSTATGFGTLIWSTNAGLSSLALICSVGIIITMLTCVFLLPNWYRWAHRA